MTEAYHDEHYRIVVNHSSTTRCLFNKPHFIRHQNDVQQSFTLVFCLVKQSDNTPLATLDFSHKEHSQQWFSPVTGAFSHMESVKSLTFSEAELFIEQICHYLIKEYGAEKFIWRLPPLYYDARNTNKWLNALLRLGWTISRHDLNFHLMTGDGKTFRSGLGKSKRNELNRLARNPVHFRIAESIDEISHIYHVISENHVAQGYPMTMSLSALLALHEVAKDDVIFCCLIRNEQLLAGAILLRLDEDSLYIFNWGENPANRCETPVTRLAEALYEYAQTQHYQFLDIGISTEDSVPNQGLVNFKSNIGCDITQKYTLEYVPRG
ncbi:hypothetical protein D3C81_208690 [compost metagenome]